MEQRDYLLRQIEMMAQFLAALIRKLTGLKEESSEEIILQTTNKQLNESLEISLDDLLNLPPEKLPHYLLNKTGIDKNNVELLAEILSLNAKATATESRKKELFEAALELYNWADREGNTFSLERHRKITEIKSQLE